MINQTPTRIKPLQKSCGFDESNPYNNDVDLRSKPPTILMRV